MSLSDLLARAGIIEPPAPVAAVAPSFEETLLPVAIQRNAERDAYNAAVIAEQQRLGLYGGDSIKEIFDNARTARELGLVRIPEGSKNLITHTVIPLAVKTGLAAAAPYAATALAPVLSTAGAQLVVGAIASKTFAQRSDSPAAAPAPAPPTTGGPMFEDLGGTLLGMTNAVLNYRNQRAQSAAASGALALPGGGMTANILPAAAGAGARVMSSLPSMLGLGGAISAVGGAIRSASGKILGFIVGGRRVSRKNGVALARRVGIDAAAAALGVGAVELAQAVLAEEEARSRRAGGRAITAAQLRTTRRTIGKVERAHRQIVGFCRAASVPRRAAAAPKRRR